MAKEWDARSGVLLALLSSQRVVLESMSSSAAKEGLTLQQVAVLRVIERRGPVPMNELSEELRVSPPNITGVVDRMEKKGLVRREGSPEDRRKKQIHMTERGDALFRRVRKGYSESLQASLDALTHEEQEILAKLMRKFAREVAAREDADRRRGQSRKVTEG
jgi:DNA-binding MarR family transcriptional regulator